jgi:CRISPR-associated protein Csd2
MTTLAHRYEFVYLFDVTNGNPNGDPDAANLPRIDPETNHGLVTDVCLKRKIRNYVALEMEGVAGYTIYMQEKAVLNQQHRQAYRALNIEPLDRKPPKDADQADALTRWMCANFFDVRAFGAVMSTGVNCGQVRGPMQMGFATSIEPVVPMELAITRMAVTHDRDADHERTMGRKHILPYGLYRAHGFVSAKLAERTGFTEADLELVWRALAGMFEHDRSASRGEMSARKLILFRHDHPLGNAPAHALFETVKVQRTGNDTDLPARHFRNYAVSVDEAAIPKGVSVIERI